MRSLVPVCLETQVNVRHSQALAWSDPDTERWVEGRHLSNPTPILHSSEPPERMGKRAYIATALFNVTAATSWRTIRGIHRATQSWAPGGDSTWTCLSEGKKLCRDRDLVSFCSSCIHSDQHSACP